MKLHISEKTADEMRRCGWSEDRQVDIRATSEMLERLGYYVGPIAQEILANLTGLVIQFSTKAGIVFDADKTDKVFSRERETAVFLENFVKEPICRIGYMSLSDVFVAKGGRIVVVDIEWFQMSFVRDISEYLETMAIPSTASWQTIDVPEEDRPP